MEKELNIAAILNEKPTETKLWSPMLGDCIYCYNNTYPEEIIIAFTDKNGEEKEWIFSYSGRTISAPDTAEVCLFPSKQMQDWSKFAWKKGDVLVSGDGGTEVIFDKWYDDTYTNFYGKHYLYSENENNIMYFEGFVCTTGRYFLESKDAAQTYINTIEERLGGKLNLETLEIEQHKPEFKDGDILYCKTKLGSEYIMINKLSEEVKTAFYVAYNLSSKKIFLDRTLSSVCRDEEIGILRQVTDYEKSQLFDALAKKNKAWDAKKKMIVDLKPKYEFKPFDKVLVRDSKSDNWRANLFGYIGKDGYYRCVYANWVYCIPYIGNESLLGTTKDVEG